MSSFIIIIIIIIIIIDILCSLNSGLV